MPSGRTWSGWSTEPAGGRWPALVLHRRNRCHLAGVPGALGNRVNGTPGYGRTVKPAIGMVLTWEQTLDGQWRYWLRPEMRRAIEELNPR